MKGKKFFTSLAVCALVLSMSACGSNISPVSEYSAAENAASFTETTNENTGSTDASQGVVNTADAEVIIFADKSLDGAVEAMKESYEASHPGIRVIRNFDDPDRLATELTNRARADIFITADKAALDSLDASAGTDANPNSNNLIEGSTRVELNGTYYAGKLINAFYPESASEFLTWLQTDEALQILAQADALHAAANLSAESAAASGVS